MAGIINFFALGGRKKRFKANDGLDKNLWNIGDLDADTSVPATRFALDCKRLNLSVWQWAMVADFDFTDFRYNKLGKPTTNTTYQRFCEVRKRHRVIETFALKAREPRIFAMRVLGCRYFGTLVAMFQASGFVLLLDRFDIDIFLPCRFFKRAT